MTLRRALARGEPGRAAEPCTVFDDAVDDGAGTGRKVREQARVDRGG
jgi:hypothetical protein